MNNYKLVACDLDGTLLNSDMKVSGENLRAIKELTAKGIYVVPATGRTVCEMREIFDLDEIRYVVYSNGAAIFDKKTGENVFLGIDDGDLPFIYDTLESFDTLNIIHKDGKTYVDKQKGERMHDYHVSPSIAHVVNSFCVFDDDFKKTFLGGTIECMSTFFVSDEDKHKCFEIIRKNPNVCAVEGWNYNLEIFGKKAGKGNALKILAEKLNIKMENVITIGDSDNDSQMTKMSGLGLAAANGCESLKKTADKVICTNDEHVLKYVKEHYFD